MVSMLKLKEIFVISRLPICRSIHSSAICEKNRQAGKTKTSKHRTTPLTYEAAHLPQHIAHNKSWNSVNTSSLQGGPRTGDIAIEDEFIRRFMKGTWHRMFLSEVIIKRQFNIIRIAGVIYQATQPRKMYFLIGYTEELLSSWLQCPVKLELQTVYDKKDVIFKYI